MNNIEKIKELYFKKVNNTATEIELFELDIMIKTSCMDEKFLMEILK